MSNLTSEEYASTLGNECPACLSDNIRPTEGIQQDEGICWQSCKCDDCDAEWVDEYSLTGFDRLETTEGD